jgi:hypothetical protein
LKLETKKSIQKQKFQYQEQVLGFKVTITASGIMYSKLTMCELKANAREPHMLCESETSEAQRYPAKP